MEWRGNARPRRGVELTLLSSFASLLEAKLAIFSDKRRMTTSMAACRGKALFWGWLEADWYFLGFPKADAQSLGRSNDAHYFVFRGAGPDKQGSVRKEIEKILVVAEAVTPQKYWLCCASRRGDSSLGLGGKEGRAALHTSVDGVR